MTEVLLKDLHVKFILDLDKRKDTFAYWASEHLRLSGVYWGLTALHLLRNPDALDREEVIQYVLSCMHPNGGFGGHTDHDPHLLYTLSAVQLLAILDALDRVDIDLIASYVKSLERPDGSFVGDEWGEVDTRFSYCAISCLSLLGRLFPPEENPQGGPIVVATVPFPEESEQEGTDTGVTPKAAADNTAGVSNHAVPSNVVTSATETSTTSLQSEPQSPTPLSTTQTTITKYIDLDKAITFIHSCKNLDGGYGSVPGAESHAGQIFCCVGALSIAKSLHLVDVDELCWWLAERQTKKGGLNGRPEKLEDVCYSWWVLSCLSMLGKLHWINKDKLIKFILQAQDPDEGGIADRPGDVADVFHTVFGVAGLSMLGYPDLDEVDPRYCMPAAVTKRMGLGSGLAEFQEGLGAEDRKMRKFLPEHVGPARKKQQ